MRFVYATCYRKIISLETVREIPLHILEYRVAICLQIYAYGFSIHRCCQHGKTLVCYFSQIYLLFLTLYYSITQIENLMRNHLIVHDTMIAPGLKMS